MSDYGRFLGERFRDRDNLVWVIGGDHDPGDLRDKMRLFVAGSRERDDRHLFTAHVHPESSAVVEYAGDDWLTLNQTYSYRIVHRSLIEDYQRTPVLPFILFESTYEGEHEASELQDPSPGMVGTHMPCHRPVLRQLSALAPVTGMGSGAGDPGFSRHGTSRHIRGSGPVVEARAGYRTPLPGRGAG